MDILRPIKSDRRSSMAFETRVPSRLLIACGFALLLTDCAGTNARVGSAMASAPQWLGGEPADAPPRRDSPEYQTWLAQHSQAAQTPTGTAAQTAGNQSQPDWIGH